MKFGTRQAIIYFAVFATLLLYFLYYRYWIAAWVFGFCILLGIFTFLFPDSNSDDDNYYPGESSSGGHQNEKKDYLTYYGDQLSLSADDILSILQKHSYYFSMLDELQKDKFIKRLSSFMFEKTFRIHDKSGFREMPVLICASAIQVSFGLAQYELPHFKYINIYPAEFVEIQKTIRFLEGNVSGNSINISWKYFIEGFQFPRDGKNVGLHEMAHAYYYQNFGPCEDKDPAFISAFDSFNTCGNKIFADIQRSDPGIYSDYAKRNFQEFWAESIEVFFEKSMEMRTTYPSLYAAINGLLNQDPANMIT